MLDMEETFLAAPHPEATILSSSAELSRIVPAAALAPLLELRSRTGHVACETLLPAQQAVRTPIRLEALSST